jgi:hypothetical protein
VCNNLNGFCLKESLDVHFICNLRPEVRNKLNEIDPELSKVMDGSDVVLNWDGDHIIRILKEKVRKGAPEGKTVDLDNFFPTTITFGGPPVPFERFLLNQTWHRPRDMVRFLKAYAKISPNDESITEDGTKRCLNEYARISAVELFEEISVRYSPNTIEGIRKSITTRRYENSDELAEALRANIAGISIPQLMTDLFDAGVIGNVDTNATDGFARNFWSYRGEEGLDPSMQISVHWGLLNFFNVRHR